MALVVLEYDDLLSDKDLSEQILAAYGAGSVGALGVRGVPHWGDMRSKTLPLAHSLQALPKDQLAELEDEPSMWNAGWSLGKEKMGDTPDFSKASFYYNPLTDDPSPELRSQFPWSVPANKWPREDAIPGFKANCCEIGTTMKHVAELLAKHIDRLLIARVPGYEAGLFKQAIESSTKAKARVLYYFPIDPAKAAASAGQTDNWIAWHNDSGFLTCLAGEIFVDHSTGNIISNPEPNVAGLWIADR
jgi:isopenicillin N synthase-like dioxygenase